jgi:hypothetical protein
LPSIIFDERGGLLQIDLVSPGYGLLLVIGALIEFPPTTVADPLLAGRVEEEVIVGLAATAGAADG